MCLSEFFRLKGREVSIDETGKPAQRPRRVSRATPGATRSGRSRSFCGDRASDALRLDADLAEHPGPRSTVLLDAIALSFIPGIGTVIGGAIGALITWLVGLTADEPLRLVVRLRLALEPPTTARRADALRYGRAFGRTTPAS